MDQAGPTAKTNRMDQAMPRLEWRDEFSLNVKLIDDQHKELIRLANLLHEAAENHWDDGIVEELIEGITAHAATHFTDEEAVFRNAGYPKIAYHEQEHQVLVQELMELKEDLALGFVHVAGEISDWVWRRVIPHLLNADKAAADWVRSVSPQGGAVKSLSHPQPQCGPAKPDPDKASLPV